MDRFTENARRVCRDSDGTLHTVYIKDDSGTIKVFYAKSTDEGVNWTGQVALYTQVTMLYDPCIVVDANKKLWAFWRDTNVGIITESKAFGGAWSGPTTIASHASYPFAVPHAAVDYLSNIWVVFATPAVGIDCIVWHNGPDHWDAIQNIGYITSTNVKISVCSNDEKVFLLYYNGDDGKFYSTYNNFTNWQASGSWMNIQNWTVSRTIDSCSITSNSSEALNYIWSSHDGTPHYTLVHRFATTNTDIIADTATVIKGCSLSIDQNNVLYMVCTYNDYWVRSQKKPGLSWVTPWSTNIKWKYPTNLHHQEPSLGIYDHHYLTVAHNSDADVIESFKNGVPGVPGTLSVARGIRQLDLTWSLPSDDGGSPVDSYVVNRGTAPAGETKLLDTGSDAVAYSNTGLGNGETFYYTVQGTNTAGDGTASNEDYETTYNLPTAPLTPGAAPIDNEITDTWTAPADTDGQAVTNYKIYRNTVPSTPILLDTVGDVLIYHDVTIAGSTTYFYSFSCVTAVGEGPKSSEVSAKSYGPPDPPTALVTTSIDRGNIINWTAPVWKGGGSHVITGYRLYADDISPPTTLIRTGGPENGSYEIGIPNSRTRFYRVVALNDFTPDPDGEFSSIVVGVPHCHAPTGFVRRHLAELIGIKPRIGPSTGGQDEYGATFYAYGRVEPITKRERDARTQLLSARNRVIVDGSVPVTEGDEIIMPDGRTMPVIAVIPQNVNISNGVVTFAKEVLS